MWDTNNIISIINCNIKRWDVKIIMKYTLN